MKTFKVVHDVVSDASDNLTVVTIGDADTADEARHYALEMLSDKVPFDGYHIFEVSCEEITAEVDALNGLLGDIEIDL